MFGTQACVLIILLNSRDWILEHNLQFPHMQTGMERGKFLPKSHLCNPSFWGAFASLFHVCLQNHFSSISRPRCSAGPLVVCGKEILVHEAQLIANGPIFNSRRV